MELNNMQNIQEKMDVLNDKLEQFNTNYTEQNKYSTKGNNIPYVTGTQYQIEHKALDDFIRKGIVTKTGLTEHGDGKILLAPKLHENIVTTMCSLSPMRRLARVDTINSNSLDLIIENDEFYIGWANCLDAVKETQPPKLEKQTIHLYEMYTQPSTTQNLIDDSVINITKWLTEKITSGFAKTESRAFIMGTGYDQPKGILKYSTDEIPVRECQQNHITVDDLIGLINSLDEKYLHNATFLVNRKVLHSIYNMQDKDGRFIWTRCISNTTPETLLGIPVVCCDEMPAGIDHRGSVIALADFKQAYQIVQSKRPISIMQDPYTNKPFVKFYATKRVGGGIINHRAIKLLKCKYNANVASTGVKSDQEAKAPTNK